MREEERRLDARRELAEVAVVPGRMRVAVDARHAVGAVPADAEAVAVRRGRAELGVQALVDERTRRIEQELVDPEGRARVRHPAAHPPDRPRRPCVGQTGTGRRPHGFVASLAVTRPHLYWSVSFRVRQYVKGSLWVWPLVGGLSGSPSATSSPGWRGGRAAVGVDVFAEHRAHRADDGRRRDRRADRVRGHGQRARRADGDRHVLGALHAPLVPRRDPQGRARGADRHVHLLVLAAPPRRGSGHLPEPRRQPVRLPARRRGSCSSSSSSTAPCTGCGRSPWRRSSRRAGRKSLRKIAAIAATPHRKADDDEIAALAGRPAALVARSPRPGAIQAIDERGLVALGTRARLRPRRSRTRSATSSRSGGGARRRSTAR